MTLSSAAPFPMKKRPRSTLAAGSLPSLTCALFRNPNKPCRADIPVRRSFKAATSLQPRITRLTPAIRGFIYPRKRKLETAFRKRKGSGDSRGLQVCPPSYVLQYFQSVRLAGTDTFRAHLAPPADDRTQNRAHALGLRVHRCIQLLLARTSRYHAPGRSSETDTAIIAYTCCTSSSSISIGPASKPSCLRYLSIKLSPTP